MLDAFSPLILIVGALVVLLALGGVATSRLRKVPPNRAHVIVGMKDKSDTGKTERVAKIGSDGQIEKDEEGQPVYEEVNLDKFSTARVVTSDRYFLLPGFYDVTVLNLEQRSTDFDVQNPSSDFIDTKVTVNVQFRIGNNPQSVRRAASRFAGQQDEIPDIIGEAMAGNIRAVIGEMTVEDLISKREDFKTKVLAAVHQDFLNQGIYIDTLNIKSIDTPGSNYLNDLSAPERAIRERAAKIAEQNATREIAEHNASVEQQVANAQRELDIAKAAYDKETKNAQIESESAPKLLQADRDREIAIKEKETEKANAEAEAARLLSTVVEPAKAKAEADIEAARAVKEAARQDADAEAYKVTAAASADQSAAEAKAAAVRAAALAEADAIRAVGEAEADATTKKAEAASTYDATALRYETLKILPEIVSAASAPLSNVDSMSIISSDGANKLVGTSIETIEQITPFLKDKLGVDLSDLAGFATGTATSKGSELTQ